MQFGRLDKKPPFDAEAKQADFARRLNAIPGVDIPADAITPFPQFALAALSNESALILFLETLDWFVSEVRSIPVAGRSPA